MTSSFPSNSLAEEENFSRLRKKGFPSPERIKKGFKKKMMKQRHKIEREAQIGVEIGWMKNQEVAKKNPKLAAMNKKFGMIHGLSSLANIMSFGSLAMHSCEYCSREIPSPRPC